MKLAELVIHISRVDEKETVIKFAYGLIQPDYHLTEVISSTIRSVDCGDAIEEREG